MAKKAKQAKSIEQYEHSDKERLNNPPVGLVSDKTDTEYGQKKKKYEYDPHLDPQLQWAGKTEHTSFEVPTVSLHVHERIDPKSIIDTVKKEGAKHQQMSLFEQQEKPLRDAIEFYKHKEGWTNRLIAGDSLLVMNSLLEKEGMAGKVQMLYFDPPYGIKYGSNFQPFINKRDVTDGKDEDLTQEPEMIKAFRDTWELGIHSYLTYLRDRLLLARELLHESGSVFVQISDENIHHVREICDEILGNENFISLIAFTSTSGFPSNTLARTGDYVVWYAKDKNKVKYRQLFNEKDISLDGGRYKWIKFDDGTYRGLTTKEISGETPLPENVRLYQPTSLVSQGATNSPQEFEYKGKTYKPPIGQHWKTSIEGLKVLAQNERIHVAKNSIRYVRYANDFPYIPINNLWTDTATGNFTDEKIYVVQTGSKVISRCILMTTDPGDLVLDITCGSGTTANCCEEWGRRWITCDTSRVALTLAKQRLMSNSFDYFRLARIDEGVGSGFEYKTVPHITLRSIANKEEPNLQPLFDQPKIDSKKLRITGPFTVESIPAPFVKDLEEALESEMDADKSVTRTGETLRQDQWRDELQRTGVRAKGGAIMKFSRIEALSGTKYIQAQGEMQQTADTTELKTTNSKLSTENSKPPTNNSKLTTENSQLKTLIVFGPEHAPLEQRTVELAIDEARYMKPDILLFCAFQFDDEAAKDIDEIPEASIGFKLLKAQMNMDLQTEDLKKNRNTNQSFWLIGQPDVRMSSFEFLVFRDTVNNEKIIASYDIFKELSGLNSLAEINELGDKDLLLYLILSQGGNVWHYLANEKGWDIHPGKYSRGAGKEKQERIQSVSLDSTGFVGRVRDFYNHLTEFGISDRGDLKSIAGRLLGNKKDALQLEKIAYDLKLPTNNYQLSTKNSQLSTKNYSTIEVMGFDYFNPKNGNIESGGKKNIAMWLLDTDYDGRSLFPKQVFFPMAGATDGWAKLAKNLKAEIDEEKIEAFRGTESLPFEPGKQIAIKIIDDRGIESLKIITR